MRCSLHVMEVKKKMMKKKMMMMMVMMVMIIMINEEDDGVPEQKALSIFSQNLLQFWNPNISI
jgi:hypothetical protein